MSGLPQEIERLGPELRAWIEHQLLEDLRCYGVRSRGPSIDWSRAVQEGHTRDYRGAMLESLSDIDVVDGAGAVVANGWMDFLDTSEDEALAPVVFWLFLDLLSGDCWTQVKTDANLPAHVWDGLTETQKAYVAGTESKWLVRDPKVRDRLRPPS